MLLGMKYLARFKWPIVMAVVGIAFGVLAVAVLIQAFEDTGTSFVGPGETTVSIAEPGEYRLWHEPKSYIDGKLVKFSDELPEGISIQVLRQPQGDPVALQTSGGTMSMEMGETRRVVVGRLEFPSAGEYTIIVDGLDEKRAFYLGEIRFWRFFASAFLLGIVAFTLFGGSIAWAIYVVIKLSNRTN